MLVHGFIDWLVMAALLACLCSIRVEWVLILNNTSGSGILVPLYQRLRTGSRVFILGLLNPMASPLSIDKLSVLDLLNPPNGYAQPCQERMFRCNLLH